MLSLQDHSSERAVYSDTTLISAVQRRDQSALGLLYDRYAPLVFTLAKSVAPDSAEALTERVFYRLWSSQAILTRPGPLINTLIDLTEQACRSESGLLPGSSNRPGALFAVLTPFARLSPGIYELIVLAYVGQLDVIEIACALDISLAQVREALTSGLMLVRSAGIGRDRVL